MSWWPLLVLAVSACGFEVPSSGQLPVPDSSPLPDDTDGDTVRDATDNCPQIANLDQRDHDADGKGDACDLCPHLASTTDPDGDSDGVGDACDPQPSSPTEMRYAWTGFDDSSLPTGWIATFPNWTINNGKLRLDGTGRILQVGPTVDLRAVSVALSAEVMAIGSPFLNSVGNTVYPTLGTASGQIPSTQEYACYTFKDSANRMAATAFFNNNYTQTSVNWSGDFAVGAKFEVVQTIVGNNRCEIRTAGPPTTMASDNEAIGPSSTGVISGFAAASIVELDYMFVVSSR